ncbi:MAG: hypothetical protein ACTSU9_20045 [Promethearchaeota archaeon]
MMDLIYFPYRSHAMEYLKRDSRCECRGAWRVVGVEFKIVKNLPVTEYRVECSKCKASQVIAFDTSSFSCKC